MSRDYDNHDRFNIGRQCSASVAFLVWCAVGMLCALALAFYLGIAQANAQTVHKGASADGWSARILPPLERPRVPGRTYALTPLPEIALPALDRAHLDAILAWSIARQRQHDEMVERHRRGIVLPDEL